jgi:hypothetical protein
MEPEAFNRARQIAFAGTTLEIVGRETSKAIDDLIGHAPC